MPRKCCVTGCKSNYASSIEGIVKTFLMREEWKSKIPRDIEKISCNTGVCAKHFDDRFIIKEDVYHDSATGWNLLYND